MGLKIIFLFLDRFVIRTKWHLLQNDREIRLSESVLKGTLVSSANQNRGFEH